MKFNSPDDDKAAVETIAGEATTPRPTAAVDFRKVRRLNPRPFEVLSLIALSLLVTRWPAAFATPAGLSSARLCRACLVGVLIQDLHAAAGLTTGIARAPVLGSPHSCACPTLRHRGRQIGVSTLPVFRMPLGSSARFRRRISASLPGLPKRASAERLSRPTPCSAEKEPPSSASPS